MLKEDLPIHLRYNLRERLHLLPGGVLYRALPVCPASGARPGREVSIAVFCHVNCEAISGSPLEARLAALESLKHPAVQQILEHGLVHEGPAAGLWVVRECIEGETLQKRLARSPAGLRWEEVRPLFGHLLEGLAYAAAKGVCHGRLSPASLLCCQDGSARLTDFDLSPPVEEGGETQDLEVTMNWDYVAPEALRTNPDGSGVPADLFSFGVCLYEAISGSLPWPPLGPPAVMEFLKRWKENNPPPPSFDLTCFSLLRRAKPFLQKCLSQAPEKRFASFEEACRAFRRIDYLTLQAADGEDYQLMEQIGKGGYGVVYRGRQVQDNRPVAIKRLLAGQDPERFLREARLLRQYQHPHVVAYLDLIQTEDGLGNSILFLVMEFLPGMPGASLRQRIQSAPQGLDPEETIRLFLSYLKALAFLHESASPVIHRDITPGNLYAPPGQPEQGKLLDLGIARDLSGTLTLGSVPGTLRYMAPEFALRTDERGSARTDLFSLGLCLYEALTGISALPALPSSISDAARLFMEQARRPPPIAFENPVFLQRPLLRQAVESAISFAPSKRPNSAAAMAKALRAELDRAPTGESARAIQQVSAPVRPVGKPSVLSPALPATDSPGIPPPRQQESPPAALSPPFEPLHENIPLPQDFDEEERDTPTAITIPPALADADHRSSLQRVWTLFLFLMLLSATATWFAWDPVQEFIERHTKITVTSHPPGAELWDGDLKLGVTPLYLARISPGVHRLQLFTDGHESVIEELRVRPFFHLEHHVVLRKLPAPQEHLRRLTIRTFPPADRAVLMQEEKVLATWNNLPSRSVHFEVPPGEYSLILTLEGYRSTTHRVVVGEQNAVVMRTLDPLQQTIGPSKTGSVQFDAPLRMDVWHDGRRLGTTDEIIHGLPAGETMFTLTARGFDSRDLVVLVRAGTTVHAQCPPLSRSTPVPRT